MVGINESVVTIFSPKGRPNGVQYGVVDPVAWAKSEIADIMSSPTSSGKPLRDYPDIVGSIYGYGDWTIGLSMHPLTNKPTNAKVVARIMPYV